jgi:AAA domain
MLDLAARVTTGSPMPGEDLVCVPPSDVVLLAAEDGLADTIRPRLDAAGADASRVHHLDSVPTHDDEGRIVAWVPPSIPEDLAALEALIVETGSVLVVVDVLMAYLSGRADSHRDQDVRRSLAQLAEIAAGTGACVVLLRHLRKTRGPAMYAGGGSVGIIGVARAGMVAAVDPDDETGRRRVLARSKGNLAPPWRSLAYELVTDETRNVVRVRWLGETSVTGDQLLAVRPDEPDDDGDDAAAVLAQVLTDGPLWVKQAIDKMAEAGFSKDQAKRAKRKLKVRSVKHGAPGDADQGWKWVLPGSEGSTEGGEGSGGAHPAPFAPFVHPSEGEDGDR